MQTESDELEGSVNGMEGATARRALKSSGVSTLYRMVQLFKWAMIPAQEMWKERDLQSGE